MATSFTMPKLLRPQTFPYANSSTGPYRGLLVRKYPCWEAQGLVRDVFTEEIAGKIKTCLEQCLPESNSFIGFSLFMVGKLPDKTKPTIMIVSDDKPRRKAAFQVVKSKNILATYPGFELGHCSVAAEFEDLKRLGSDSWSWASDEESFTSLDDLDDYKYLADECEPGVEVLGLLSVEACAFEIPDGEKPTRLYFHASSKTHSHSSASATCGGLIRHRDEIYAITMAHAIHPFRRVAVIPEPYSDSSSQSDDFEITGVEDWNEDDEDDTKTLAGITSPGSKTPSEFSDSEESLPRRFDWRLSSEISSRTSLGIGPPIFHKEDYIIDRNERGEYSDEGLEACERVGSVVGVDQELDIALIKATLDMSTEDPGEPPYAQSILENSFAEDDPSSASIVIKTTHHSEIKGQRSPTPFYTRLPGSSNFLELYGVRLSTLVRPGDCGSWAFNDKGKFAGLVVAGNPETGSCLLLPSVHVLGSVRTLLMIQKELGTWVNSLDETKFRSGGPGRLDGDSTTVTSSLPPPSIFSHRGTPSTIARSTTTVSHERRLEASQARETLPRGDTGSASSFVGKGDIMKDQVARLQRELKRASEIIQEKNEQPRRLLIDNMDNTVNAMVGSTVSPQPKDDSHLQLDSPRGWLQDMRSWDKQPDSHFDFTFEDQEPHQSVGWEALLAEDIESPRIEQEKNKKSIAERMATWRAQMKDANHALDQENIELKRDIMQAIEAIYRLSDHGKEAAYNRGLLKIVSDLGRRQGSDASTSLLKVKSESIPTNTLPLNQPQLRTVRWRVRLLSLRARVQGHLFSTTEIMNNLFSLLEEDEDDEVDSTAPAVEENNIKGEVKDEEGLD